VREAAARGDVQREVEQFLYHEAWLLDERRLHDWLALFADDARYSLQVREVADRTEDGGAGVRLSRPLFDDDLAFLTLRVKRLDTRLAHAEQPPSITRHLITNVLVLPAERDDELTVRSNFLVFQARTDLSEHLLSGGREDVLRRIDGGWKIARRRVALDKTTLPRTITIFF
jgi:3-phenylpropionate/cinnamic acid dioxygenase small subunit